MEGGEWWCAESFSCQTKLIFSCGLFGVLKIKISFSWISGHFTSSPGLCVGTGRMGVKAKPSPFKLGLSLGIFNSDGNYTSILFQSFGTSVRRSSRSALGRSTGNDISGHCKRHYFLSFFFLRCLLFS